MEIIPPRIETLELTKTYGKFSVEPLERGFGVTLGNSLRRVLLSSIPGAAVTGIKIDGILHEFSTIPGAREDTTELMLNLKDLHVRVHHPEGESEEDALKPKTLKLDVQGEGVVTGADIETTPEVEIVNPGVKIVELTENDASLTMELTVEEGKGYLPPDRRDAGNWAIGFIPLGAVFGPVRRASYLVESTRVGRKTDLERLILEVWTNGTMSPHEAVSHAASTLHGYTEMFISFPTGRRQRPLEAAYAEEKPAAGRAPDARIEELDFSVRTYNCLKKENILTIGELVQRTEADLIGIRNFGAKSLAEVIDKLAQFGLTLDETAGEGRTRRKEKESEAEADTLGNDGDEAASESNSLASAGLSVDLSEE